MKSHKYLFRYISTDEKFIDDISSEYLLQRSKTRSNIAPYLTNDKIFKDVDFSPEKIKKLITAYSTPTRKKDLPPKLKQFDIYRSDLGELLMTRYFERDIDCEENFIVPFKNIEDREISDMPGRGLDAVGYKVSNGKLQLLLGEAKVSNEKINPPHVVHHNKDSIYKKQKQCKIDKEYLLKRLVDVIKKVSVGHASYLSIILLAIEEKAYSCFDTVYGCFLVRDKSCFCKNSDFGKLLSKKNDFEPGLVHFMIYCFEQNIDQVVNSFYSKVDRLRMS